MKTPTCVSKLPHAPSLVEYDGMRFLILDCPTESNIHLYTEVLKSYGITTMVRTCTPTYSTEPFRNEGVKIVDLVFPDGSAPSTSLLASWFQLCGEVFGAKPASDGPILAVHCIAGLGRAPLLVAIALIERGVEPAAAIKLVREKRNRAFNSVQLNYLLRYKKSNKGCTIL